MAFSKEVECLLRDLAKVKLEDMFTGSLGRTSRPVHNLIGKYLRRSPSLALKLAQEALVKVKEQQRSSMTDWTYWDLDVDRSFYEALVAVFRGVMRGRRKFPPLEKSRRTLPGPFDKTDFWSWAMKVKRTNPCTKRNPRRSG